MKFTEASLEQADIIVDFQMKMALETENFELNKKTVTAGVKAVFQDKSKGQYYVVLDKGRVIASLLTTYEWSDWRNASVLWIQSVYVLPSSRTKGVFRLMYSALKNMVEQSSKFCGIRLYVDKRNLKAQKVYDKIGMSGVHYILYEDME